MPSKANKKNIPKSNSHKAKSNDSKQTKAKKSGKQKLQKKESVNKSINMKQKPNKKGTKKAAKKKDIKHESKKPKKVPSANKLNKSNKSNKPNKPKHSKKPLPPIKKLPKSQPKPPNKKLPKSNSKHTKKPQTNSKQNIKKKATHQTPKKKHNKANKPKKIQKAHKSAPPKTLPPTPKRPKKAGATNKQPNTDNINKPKRNKSKQRVTPKSQPKSNSKKLPKPKKKDSKRSIAKKPKTAPIDTKKVPTQQAKKKRAKPLPNTPRKVVRTKAKKVTPQKRKQDRRTIQHKKDIKTAKKRLSKRLSLKLNPTDPNIIRIDPTSGKRKKKTTPKQKNKPKATQPKKTQPVHPPVKPTKRVKAVQNNRDLWDDYVSRFGGEPTNASQLQSFSKTDVRYTTLTYKGAKDIFDKFGHKEVQENATKKDRDKIYIKRDIDTAKKRLSARLSAKYMTSIMDQIAQRPPVMDIIQDVNDSEEDSESSSSTSHTEEDDQGEIRDRMDEDHESDEMEETDEDDSVTPSPAPMGGEFTVSYIPPVPKRSVSIQTDKAKAARKKRPKTPPLPQRPPRLPERTRTLDETQRKRVRIAKQKGALPPLPRRRTVSRSIKSSPLLRGKAKTVGAEHTVDVEYTSRSIIEIEKFVESERAYVKSGLRICCEVFLHRLKIHNHLNESILSDEDIQTVFTNYAMIYNVNNKLFGDLMEIRLNEGGVYALRDRLGQIMVHFIPYFKMYTDYIVKTHTALAHLEALKRSNKKFAQFLKINEACVKRKLKSFLEEPVHRLPQYLQYLATIYALYMQEDNTQSAAEGQGLLLQSIVDTKKTTDDIAASCRDLKSRMLLGALQKDLFEHKIQILSAHRLCIAHGEIRMLLHHPKEKKIKSFNLILCNDILLISTLPSKFKSSHLLCVDPLIGLRVSREPVITNDNACLLEAVNQYKFSLLPSNHVIICDDEDKMEKWIEMIQDAADEQEHSLKQCNVVDLEKRIRKQKTSKQGQSETITITNPERIKQIEAWREARYNDTDGKKEQPQTKPRSQTEYKARPALPPRKVTFNKPPAVPKKSVAAPPAKSPRAAYPPPPPRRRTVSSAKDATNSEKERETEPKKDGIEKEREMEPKKDGIEKEREMEPKKDRTEKAARRKTVGVTDAVSASRSKDTMHIPRRKKGVRMGSNLLSGIASFKSSNLKHVDEKTLKEKAVSEPSNVTNLLQSTLANYRQFVMDDDDESDSDDEWSD
eukprot:620681_1